MTKEFQSFLWVSTITISFLTILFVEEDKIRALDGHDEHPKIEDTFIRPNNFEPSHECTCEDAFLQTKGNTRKCQKDTKIDAFCPCEDNTDKCGCEICDCTENKSNWLK